ncbi:putative sulfate/molybdate transporter [Haloprofundus sp. MHR1]|uniref:putative sulfate/molybdate transporter n=1 Tax=Haloprofundus sp. MHR1 TaxID=2572921 RepID=UPI0010BEEADE|nr:putative sulfate/molybdate transporter [Haloprofundus sp. MHR1]QCJ45764.1 sulfate transporter [Haloprofundus sp. MHR1]
MALADVRESRTIRFDTGEVTGALGDSVTVLPIVVALGALTPMSLSHVLVAFGLFQVVWGVAYGLPLSVEPMKALAALAIAGALSYGELVAAGLVAGAVLLLAGRTSAISSVERYVGEPVVRGVQLAVALLLAQTGVELGLGNLALAALAVALTLGVAAAGRPRAATLVVLGVGGAMAAATAGVPTPQLPALGVFPAGGPALTLGAVEGATAQLAMTVGNAAVATSLLCSDLFDADVSADDLSTSMGVMTLLSVPFGGLPMCHGSGGLAGKYAFGARTGGANVVLGALYVVAALFAGVVLAFPMALLGVLLVLVAAQLARSAVRTESLALTVLVGLVGVATNVGVAFVVGVVLWLGASRLGVAGTADR